MQQNKNCDGDIMQLVSVPNLHRREARAFQKTSQQNERNWREREREWGINRIAGDEASHFVRNFKSVKRTGDLHLVDIELRLVPLESQVINNVFHLLLLLRNPNALFSCVGFSITVSRVKCVFDSVGKFDFQWNSFSKVEFS